MPGVQGIKGPLEIIEEAVFILRRNILSTLTTYYIGTLPFIAAFLYFWSDLSQNAFAEERIVPESLVLALLFVWMKCWHTAFCEKIVSYIRLQTQPSWSLKRILGAAASHSILAGTWAVVLPLSIITAVPFGWIYAFYQNTAIVGDGKGSLKETVRKSWYSAKTLPGQNHIILAVITVFALFVLINIAVAIYSLPFLLKTLFGLESAFTISGQNIFSTTFLAVSLGLTYLAIDPLIKTVYTLRSHYIFSIKTGDDLRADLLSLKIIRKGSGILLFFIVLSSTIAAAGGPVTMNTLNSRPLQVDTVSADRLNNAIDKIIRQREYAWRIPRKESEKEDSMGAMERFIKWSFDRLRDLIKTAVKLWHNFQRVLSRIFPDIRPGKPSGGLSHKSMYIALISILCLLGSVLAFVIWKQLRAAKSKVDRIQGLGITSVPDLRDDFINPVELTSERWLKMGYDLMKKPPFTLSLRAFYLSILAGLAEKGLISITRYKTNMDYITELKRRARKSPELISIFSESVLVFDSSWYGSHEVTETLLDRFIHNRERMVEIIHG